MFNFLLSVLGVIAVAFALIFAVRYGVRGAERLDAWLQSKSNRSFDGYNWYYRIPFSAGAIPEYFYAMVLQRDNYYKTNWWALKTSSFLSVLLFVAILKNRSEVAGYYTSFWGEELDYLAFLNSGTFVWYLDVITLLYVVLGLLVVVESIKMAGFYAPVRILYYGILCFFMSDLTILVLSVIVLSAILYLVFKVVKFLFFNSSSRQKQEDDEETAGEILGKGFSGFKKDLYEWEAERKTKSVNRKRNKPKKRPPVITRRVRKKAVREVYKNEDIPRLHPD